MIASSFQVLARTFALAGLLAACTCVVEAQAQNLVSNGSFENGSWGGTASFVDPNNGTALLYWDGQVNGWVPNSNSVWVQDAVRAEDGNRMVWLGPPSSLYQLISTTSLQSNQNYHLSLAYDFFDRNDPEGSMSMDSTLTISYVLGTYMDMGGGSMMLEDDFSTFTSLYSTTGMTDAWSNGANMDWMTASFNFQLPDLDDNEYLRLIISAPSNSVPTPSMGVLIDNVSLTVAVVPEPASLLLVALSALCCQRRRRHA